MLDKKSKKIWSNLGLVLLSVLVTGLISELVVRWIMPQQLVLIRPDVWCANKTFGWKLCPHVSTSINSGDGFVHLTTDQNGFRIDPQNIIKDPKRKILVLGDSFMEAIQVEDNQTTAAQLSLLFKRNYNLDVEVINTGVGQWDPNQYYIQAKQILNEEKFDLGIIFIYLANDIIAHATDTFMPRKSSIHFFRFPKNLSKPEIIDSVLYPINDFLEQRSHFFVLFKKTFSVVLMKLGLSAHSISNVFLVDEFSSSMWNNTIQILKKIKLEFSKKNIPSLFVLIPSSYQINKNELDKLVKGFSISSKDIDIDQPNKILKKALMNAGIDFFDPTDKLRDQPNTDFYGEVDNHLNKKGHEYLSQLVFKFIIEKNYKLILAPENQKKSL